MSLFTQNLSSFVEPAILLSALVFLVRFFGKIIADQVPFVDDRKWHIELAGVMFVWKYFISAAILPVIIFIVLKKWLVYSLLSYASVILIFTVFLYLISRITYLVIKLDPWAKALSNKETSEKIHKIPASILNDFNNSMAWWSKFCSRPLKSKELSRLSSLILLSSIILLYNSSNVAIQFLSVGFVFISYFFIAFFDSLLKSKDLFVDVYMKNGEIFDNCQLLKMNEGNLKIKNAEKFIILNKDEFYKICLIKEMPSQLINQAAIK
jgi:hypothetical protein